MVTTVAETIRGLTARHIAERDGLVMGQCLSAVGWVQNTVPAQEKGIVELPMSDIAAAGYAVGAAIMGRRPLLVIRFQSFLWLNASPIVNHAAKAKEIFGYPAPLMVRAIAAEGKGTGPLHSNCYHSMFMHMPGLPVCAPMTPGEYEAIWDYWLSHDDPLFVSEHRRSYTLSAEMPDQIASKPDITLFAISASRLNAVEAVKLLAERGVRADLVHIVWLKPFTVPDAALASLKASGCGMVVDSGYEIAGASQSCAYDLMYRTGAHVRALGQADHSPGASRLLENGTPTPERIASAALRVIEEQRSGLAPQPNSAIADVSRDLAAVASTLSPPDPRARTLRLETQQA